MPDYIFRLTDCLNCTFGCLLPKCLRNGRLNWDEEEYQDSQSERDQVNSNSHNNDSSVNYRVQRINELYNAGNNQINRDKPIRTNPDSFNRNSIGQKAYQIPINDPYFLLIQEEIPSGYQNISSKEIETMQQRVFQFNDIEQSYPKRTDVISREAVRQRTSKYRQFGSSNNFNSLKDIQMNNLAIRTKQRNDLPSESPQNRLKTDYSLRSSKGLDRQGGFY